MLVSVPDCDDVALDVCVLDTELVKELVTVDVPVEVADEVIDVLTVDVTVVDGEVTSQRRYDSSSRVLMNLFSSVTNWLQVAAVSKRTTGTKSHVTL